MDITDASGHNKKKSCKTNVQQLKKTDSAGSTKPQTTITGSHTSLQEENIK